MFPTQIVATHRRLPGLTVLMVASAFALGALTALGAQRVLDEGSQAGVASGATTLTTGGDMTAAAYAATQALWSSVPPSYGPSSISVGGTANDMTAAAYAATRALWSSVPPSYGPGSSIGGTANDMSAAAYAAMRSATTGP